MRNNDYESMLFETYSRYYPLDADHAIDWYLFDDTQLIVEMDDGAKVLYDHMDQTIRYLRRPDTLEELDEEKWKVEFSQRLRKKMDLSGIGQDLLSERTGISRPMISHYITGKSIPSLYNASKIARVLKCSLNEFVRFPK